MGMITDIQRFSLHDGPGIRTTVFFKGCNMSCAWCHNPETLCMAPQLHVYSEKCSHCGHCVPVCPTGARKQVGDQLLLDRSLCTSCGACASECFYGALLLSGREMSCSQVMEEVLQDRDYYAQSGGGVTLSGGEVLCQPSFAKEILTACKEQGISTAIETNMLAPWSDYVKLLPLCDLVMLDLKIYDGKLHKELTLAENANILASITRLCDGQIPVIVRTPVIPGVNDTMEAITAIAQFLSPLRGIVSYELLNFNPLGANKYQSLDMENRYQGVLPLSDAQMQLLSKAGEISQKPMRVG